MANQHCSVHIRTHERESERFTLARPHLFRVLCGAHAELPPGHLSWLELAHVLDRQLFSPGDAVCAACASLVRLRGRSLVSFLLTTMLLVAAVGCGGGAGENASANAPPSPSANASAADAAPPAPSAPSAIAAVVDAGPPAPPSAAPLVARPAQTFCTWTGKRNGALALRGEPHGAALASLALDNRTLHATLVDPKAMFVETSTTTETIHGFASAQDVVAAHDIAFGDALTLNAGARTSIATAAGERVTLEPPSVDNLTFTTPPAPAEVACDALTIGDVPSTPDSGTSTLAYAQLGAKPVQLFAQPSGSAPIATAHDLVPRVIEKKPGWLKVSFDGKDARVVAWMKAASATKTMTPQQKLLDDAQHMQMTMLGALSGGATQGSVSGAASKAGPPALHCAARVTVSFGSPTAGSAALVTLSGATFVLRGAVRNDGPTQVELPASAGLKPMSQMVQTFIRAEEASACTAKDASN
jgi:hypothetical protein